MRTIKILMALVLWSGRVLAVGLFLLWGAFFLEHLEWFLHPAHGWPPLRVWMFQLAHLAMLLGLLMLLRWEFLGSTLTVLAALIFFAGVAGSRFPLFFAVTVLPAALILLGRFLRSRQPSRPAD